MGRKKGFKISESQRELLKQEKDLIVGSGEVGKSLHNILSAHYQVNIIDRERPKLGYVRNLHICFPYSDDFIKEVKKCQRLYRPLQTIVHSTVRLGTNRKLNSISSPILGVHPNLEPGIRTFIKYLGGAQASEVADYFRRAGLKVYLFDQPETPELMKILDTTFYGVCIEYTKDVKKQCEKYGVPFEAWSLWTQNYNQGYQKLGYPEFTRPNLVPIETKIKGHCILSNTELLETPFTKLIKELNEVENES